VLARLEGDHQSEFLDGLDLFATIRFCEVLGAVALFGQRIQFNRLRDELWLAIAVCDARSQTRPPVPRSGFACFDECCWSIIRWECDMRPTILASMDQAGTSCVLVRSLHFGNAQKPVRSEAA
jgi:hypothetical protein